MHAISDVHDAIARLLATWLSTLANTSAASGAATCIPQLLSPAQHHGSQHGRTLPGHAHTLHMPPTPTDLGPQLAPPAEDEILDPALAAILQSSEVPLGWLDADDALAHDNDARYVQRNASVEYERGGGWNLAVDGRHHQAGWIARGADTLSGAVDAVGGAWGGARSPTATSKWALKSATIRFRISLAKPGYLQLAYLSTYEDIGAVFCWLNQEPRESAVRIDGRTSSRTSFIKNHIFHRVLPPGPHTLACVPAGPERFKITSVVAFAGSTFNVSAIGTFRRILQQVTRSTAGGAINGTLASPRAGPAACSKPAVGSRGSRIRIAEKCPVVETAMPCTCLKSAC